MKADGRLGIGFVGSGFITRFHIRALAGVRDADVLGVWSPNPDNAAAAAALACQENVGQAKAYPSIEAMVADPEIDALWICGPNHARVANIEAVAKAIEAGAGTLKGIACEKPLARNLREARRMVELVESVGLPNGYLENQVFFPSLVRGREILWSRGATAAGRPYLARATEEHGGPHTPWFWQGAAQGGGVLSDMMCHEIEAARFMLTDPGKSRSTLRPVSVTARTSNLKWTQPRYAQRLQAEMGREVDFLTRPVEDYASAIIELKDEEGGTLIAELTNSWSYVGPGLRITMELLGPEYSMSINTIESGPKIFFSREIAGRRGEDLVEKQNAETGLMPIVADEAAEYGYQAENRHMVRAFLTGKAPDLTFREGLEVVELLMMAYMSAEAGRTILYRPDDLDDFIPAVARA